MKKYLVGMSSGPVYVEANELILDESTEENTKPNLIAFRDSYKIGIFRDWTFYYEMPEVVVEKKTEA